MSSRPRYGSSSGSSGTIAVPPLRQGGDDLRLGLCDLLHGSEQLEVHRADARDHAHVGTGDRAQLGDLADAAHAHLADDDLGVLIDPRQRQREADLVVVPALGRDGPRVRAAEGGQDVLRRGLAGRAGDAHDPGGAPRANRAAERRKLFERILREKRRRGPAREGMAKEVLAPSDGDEEVPLLDEARVDLSPGHLIRPGRGVEPPGAERGNLFE